jgi:Protein of unknown function (DUF4019)
VRRTLGIAIVSLLLAGQPAGAQDAEKAMVNQAQEVAKAWLTLVDQAKYGQSWEGAAALFKGAVPKATWEQAAQSARAPLGAFKSRTLKSATFTRNLPGAPAGEYVVILFDAEYANKPGAVETVTPMHEKDGSWKVSGYYIR